MTNITKPSEKQTNARKRNWELRCLMCAVAVYSNLLSRYHLSDDNIERFRKAIHRQINVKYGYEPMKGVSKPHG